MPSIGQDAQFIATPVNSLHGVAEQTLSKLSKLELRNFYDVILNLPFRYEDRTYIQSLATPRLEDTPCNILLTIASAPRVKAKVTEFTAQDHEGTRCKLVFFHASQFMLKRLTIGTVLLAWGHIKVDQYATSYAQRHGGKDQVKLVITHPEIQFIEDGTVTLPTKLSPIYHLTAGLHQNRMRDITEVVLMSLVRHPLSELLPVFLNPYHMTLTEALLYTHNPEPRADHGEVLLEALPSFQRICFEELVAYKLCILELKARQVSKNATAVPYNDQAHQQLLQSLPFTPTSAQSRVFEEIMGDCAKNKAMNRLVHGDVGSGKTLVAAMVMLQFAASNLQAVLLAPTELLAQQHQRKLSELFAPLGIEVVLVSGTLKKKERDEVIKKAKSGSAKIFVGTHALFQKAIEYQHLALVIVDEQHRFGVDQREALLNKAPENEAAHELLMTATPIPRSLQQALFSDTDVSTIDVLPQGRSPITTALIMQDRYLEVVERLKVHCADGNQAYWVCPLVEENEVIDATSAKKRYEDLCANLPSLKVGLLHAQMSEKAKNTVMAEFIAGEVQVLVATTIVEVGVDVPNATVMVIENAERLGLAQLHQLRGRVGRGSKPSFCLLLYHNRNSEEIKNIEQYERGIKRLEIMRSTTNGFEIANQDLIMRGPGEFFGTNQAGKENFRFADLNRDYDLIDNAQKAAHQIFAEDAATSRNLIMRWFPEVLDQANGQASAMMSAAIDKK